MTVKGKKSDRDAFVSRWLGVLQNNIAAGNFEDVGVIVDALAREFDVSKDASS
jgi:hypothetical protein